MHARSRALVSTLFPLLAIALIAAPATAQEAEAGQESSAEQTAEIPDPALEKFARAYVDIAQVRQQMRTEMSQAGSQEERATIQQEANQQMASILQEHGLSAQRYKEITQTLNADSAQRAEFQQLVQEIQGEEGGGG